MCGACGVARTDAVTAALRGSYARLVVARLLSDVHPGVRVTAGPTGWSVAGRSRPPLIAETADELADAVAECLARCGASPADVEAARRTWPPHRAIPVPTGHDPGAGGSVPGADPSRWIHDAVAERVIRAFVAPTATMT